MGYVVLTFKGKRSEKARNKREKSTQETKSKSGENETASESSSAK